MCSYNLRWTTHGFTELDPNGRSLSGETIVIPKSVLLTIDARMSNKRVRVVTEINGKTVRAWVNTDEIEEVANEQPSA